MNSFPLQDVTPLGLPKSLDYGLIGSLSDSVRSYTCSITPDGATTITGSAAPAPLLVVGSTCAQSAFTNQVVSFTVPGCGTNKNVFLDTRETTLSGRLSYTVTQLAVGGANVKMNLLGSAASLFDQLNLYCSNAPVEQINNYGVLFNQLLNATVNTSERQGHASIAWLCDDNSFSGVDLPCSALTTYYLNFCIPILSIIGLNTAGTSGKLLPIGEIANLNLQMTTAAILPISTYCTAITTQPVFSAFTLDTLRLNLVQIDMGDVMGQMLRKSLYQSKYFIKSCSYINSNGTLAVGSSGVNTIILQIKNSSVKSLF
jgi:hypothetical protein